MSSSALAADRRLPSLGDRTTVSETRLQRNFVVQVILHDQAVGSASLEQVLITAEPFTPSYSTPDESPSTTGNDICT